MDGITAERAILCAVLASRAENQDPLDLAVLSGVKAGQQLNRYRVTHFQAFDPVHKRTEATLKTADGKALKVTKGAPPAILELSANAAQVNSAVEKAVNEFTARGFRSLDVARTDAQGQWQFLGVLPLFDPPREDSKVTIATPREMGVNVKMVTGDQMAIGREIAKQLGLGAGGVGLRPRLVPGERPCKTGSVSDIQLSTVSAIRKRQ